MVGVTGFEPATCVQLPQDTVAICAGISCKLIRDLSTYKQPVLRAMRGVLKISAVTEGKFNPREFKAVKKSAITKKIRTVKKGDFLLSRANTLELIAACCIVPKDYDQLFIPDKLWLLSPDSSTDPTFLNHLLKNESFRDTVRAKASGGHNSMRNISMKNFSSLSMPSPPPETQRKFSSIAAKIDSIIENYEEQLRELENLYAALSQKAFKGELDLSNISLPDDLPTHEQQTNTSLEDSTPAREC